MKTYKLLDKTSIMCAEAMLTLYYRHMKTTMHNRNTRTHNCQSESKNVNMG